MTSHTIVSLVSIDINQNHDFTSKKNNILGCPECTREPFLSGIEKRTILIFEKNSIACTTYLK
jgi:hypothetical protein